MDIVERLRNNADERFAVWQVVTTMNEAADEIERLREALKRIAAEPIHQCISRLSNPPVCDRAWIARAALQQKDSE